MHREIVNGVNGMGMKIKMKILIKSNKLRQTIGKSVSAQDRAVLITSVLKMVRRSFSIVALNVFSVKSLRLHSKQYLCFSLLLQLPLLLLVVVFVELAVVVPPPPELPLLPLPLLLCFSSFVGIFLLRLFNFQIQDNLFLLNFLFFRFFFIHIYYVSFLLRSPLVRDEYCIGVWYSYSLYI